MIIKKTSLGEQNYSQFADRYAEIAKTKPHNADYNFPAVVSLLTDVTGTTVLDAGCGPGFFTQWLLEQGANVIACDVTERMVEITQEKVGHRATVIRHDLYDPLEFAANETFDWIICPLVLDYIEDWSPVFAEFARVLKSKGKLVFAAGHPVGDYLWLKYRQNYQTNYFDVEEFATPWKRFGEPQPVIRFFRRPLNQILNPLIGSGLLLDDVLEPLPAQSFKDKDPAGYVKLHQEPGFICLRAVKP
ncbi:MAG: class I SAM-dependent methyltransferase [Chloroflexi bacterium]|nr:MAG: class I SAM-dependent methyltransferase [Chloroflexota bacterium]